MQIAGVSPPAREIHVFFAYPGFVLICIHAGMHLSVPLSRLRRKRESAAVILTFIAAGISIYGLSLLQTTRNPRRKP